MASAKTWSSYLKEPKLRRVSAQTRSGGYAFQGTTTIAGRSSREHLVDPWRDPPRDAARSGWRLL